ncbi:MAG: Kazal-type serine protease inhibitor domain-containing protein, partial [Pseudomonadota bacterium]|nr:Kazal-type serine protease inhibitor domain-containing protein [Pseudomonadota bacterium]
ACDVRSCTRIFAPVCGTNTTTFLNACVAERTGVNILYAGLCQEQGNNCSNNYVPVCGVDKKTYDNRCLLDNAEIRLAYAGVCFGQSN